MQFEWDPAKASLNLRKHRVSFEEAQSVFYDEFALQFFDDAHSHGEERFIMLGMSDAARLLIVIRPLAPPRARFVVLTRIEKRGCSARRGCSS